MSERRIVIEEECKKHPGVFGRHYGTDNYNDPTAACPGGSRTVISEIPTEWIEAAKARTEAWHMKSMHIDTIARESLEAAVFGGGKKET